MWRECCNYELESTEPKTKTEKHPLGNISNKVSVEEKRLLKVMKEETVMVKGDYYFPLPSEDMNSNFPNNRQQVLWRFHSLKQRFEKDQKYFQYYKELMEDKISNGYADELEDNHTSLVLTTS